MRHLQQNARPVARVGFASAGASMSQIQQNSQRLADDFGLILTGTHYPPGASKWNPVDHRMFSLISANWAGEPLVSYETVLKYLRTTRSQAGFRCRACLDTMAYPKGLKAKPEERAWGRLRPGRVLFPWNDTIWPHKHHHESATYFRASA